MRQTEFEQAGITINFELAVMQAVGMGHGLMATLASVKSVLGEEHEDFLKIQEITQARIAQCFVTLVGMGIPHDVANQRIIQGH